MALVLLQAPLVAAQIIPTNVHPADSAQNISPTPTLEINCPVSGVPLPWVAARYQIDAAGFSPPLYDSGERTSDLCSHVATAVTLNPGMYHWRAQVKDADGTWSEFSAPTTFTTVNATVYKNIFRDGTLAYSGTRDADIRGLYQFPQATPPREWNQGYQDVIRSGRTTVDTFDDETFRALLKFKLSPYLTDPSKVINAYIELTGAKHGDETVFSAAQTMYKLRRPWSEGQGIVSDPPTNGEVSWTYSAFPTTWAARGAGLASDTNPNADRGTTAIVRLVSTNQVGAVSRWGSQMLTELVKGWILDPASNHGLIIIADEPVIQHEMHFAAREQLAPSVRPMLVIETTEQAATFVIPSLTSNLATVPPGGALTVTWNGITDPTERDWIGLYAEAEADDTAFLNWTYVNCSQGPPGAPAASGSCSLIVPTTVGPGNYELRLFSNDRYTRLADSGRITVTAAAASLAASPSSVPRGGTVTAQWSGIPNPMATDWVGLYAQTGADTAFLNWVYVDCDQSSQGAPRAAGSCPLTVQATVAPGTYELRLFSNNSFTRLATSNSFTVTAAAASLVASPSSVPRGGTVTAQWNGIPNPTGTDWVGLYAQGAADTTFVNWVYVDCNQSPPGPARAAGSCPVTVPATVAPGTYQLRLFSNDGFSRLATSNSFTVTRN